LNPNLLFKNIDMKNMWKIALPAVVLLCMIFVTACVTTKKKGQETSKGKKAYHSFTNKYNYWFNADELYKLTTDKLEEQHKDNYSQILEIYPEAAADPTGVRADLDKVIQKSAKGISLHRPGTWTDDNYGLMGKAQFLKRDFETAEATYKFIKEEQDPQRSSKSKLKSKKSSKQKTSDRKKAAAKKKKEAAAKKKAAAKERKKKAAAKKKAAKNKKKGGKSTPKATETKKPAETAKPKDSEELKLTGTNPYDQPMGRTHDFPSAMIWYGRTLTERDKYNEAEFLFRELWEDRYFPKSLHDELATAEARLLIKQKKYEQAIEPLSKAVELTTSKKRRARLSYVLAQLHERSGRYQDAYAAYEKVLDSKPAYEMEFNARMQQNAAGWANGKTNSDAALKNYERMASDAKNQEYRDQLYYSMATIALKDGNKKDGISYLRKSLSYNKNNTAQRAEAYLKLADLYFEDEQFVQAKAYYDSTLTVLPADDVRHKRATEYAANLKDIARLIQTIAANDSIVRVFNMSDDERKDLVKAIKKQREAEEAAAIRNAANQPSGPAKAPAPVAGAKQTTFYFYNETFLKKGRKDFSRNWGERKLDDNWRRSNRVVAGGPDDALGADSTKNNAVADAELKDIFSNIPKSMEELSVLHMATYEAMYQLGTLYRDRLQNNVRCTGTLEELQTRYPDTARYEKETWYYCYLAFNDLKNQERAQFYYDKLIGKYPKSAYARTLTDPNFLNATKERERDLNKYYEETYTLFQKGGYKEAYTRCEEAPKKFGSQNPLVAKFALLSALCTGSLSGNDAYCAALGQVIKQYPDQPEATRAREIARVLSCKGFEVDEKKKTDAPIDDAFTLEDDKLHYFIIALTGDNFRLDEVKAAVTDYNSEFHKVEQLRISNIFLGTDTNTPIVVIRKFDNKEQAMRYYNEVKNQKDFLGETAKKTYKKEMFAVTQENYRRILKNKTLNGYREFYEENYLKKK
jgi:tetratricopeptide (TPR) repeat protein